MNTGLWLIAIIALAIAFSAITSANGFNVLTTPDGELRLAALFNRYFGSLNQKGEKKFLGSWWDSTKKDDQRLRTFWLITTLLLAYVAYSVFSKDYALAARAIATLVGFHLVWGLLPKKGSWITNVVIYGMGAYFVMMWLAPTETSAIRASSLNLSKKVLASAAITLTDANKDYGKALPPSKVAQQPQPAVATAISQPQSISASVIIPADKSIYIDRPAGHYLAAVDCPSSVVYEVIDTSTEKMIKQQDCAKVINGEHIPLNISLVFYQKEGGKPSVDAVVWWKKV